MRRVASRRGRRQASFSATGVIGITCNYAGTFHARLINGVWPEIIQRATRIR